MIVEFVVLTGCSFFIVRMFVVFLFQHWTDVQCFGTLVRAALTS
jgi:hypothetical protein